MRLEAEGKELDYVREQLYLKGIPVWGQEAVQLRGEERFETAAWKLRGNEATPDFTLGEVAAVAIAKEDLGWPEARIAMADRWYRRDDIGELRPLWRVILEKSPAEVRRVLVDAGSGKVVEVYELTNRQTAQRGFGIPTNPLFSGIQDVALPGLSGAANLNGPNIRVFSYQPIAFGGVPFSALGTPTTQLARADSRGNFYYSPSDPRFSEVQVYYGAARAADYIRSLGFSGLNRQFDAVAYYFDPQYPFDVNAFFSPTVFNGRGGIFLQVNRLGADTAFDSDVIFHEYGHATVHAIVNSLNSSRAFGAVNEAFADYFAASYFDSPAIGEFFPYLSPSPNFLTREAFLRTVDNETIYPDDVRGQPHQDSLMFSGALWDIREALGRQRGDAVAINGLARMNATTAFYSCATQLVNAARSLYGNAVGEQVRAIVAARGLVSDAARFAEAAEDTQSGVVRTGTISANAPNSTLLAADDFRIVVPTRTRGLRIEVEANPRTAPIRAYIRFRTAVDIQNGQIVSDYVLNGSTAEPGVLDGTIAFNLNPELQQGEYYVVVANRSGGPINYALRMTNQPDPVGQNSFVTALSPGVTSSGSAPNNFLNSRQFRIDVPPGTTGMEVVLEGDRDVDLYLNHGQPVRPGGEGLPLAEGISNSVENTERIVITGATVPNLRSGSYYVAVQNYDRTASSQFRVRATFRNDAPYAASPEVVPAGESRNLFLPASTNTATLLTRQFRVDGQIGWTGVQFEATSNSNVLMLIRRAQAVVFNNGIPEYDASLLVSSETARITFDANSTPPFQVTPYYIAFLSLSDTGGSLNFRWNSLPLAAGAGPRINAVVDGASFAPRISPGAWITITGEGLARSTRLWGDSDFVNGRLPTALDGVSVTVGGTPAWIYFVSPNQLNVLVPQGLAPGTRDVVVSLDGRPSTVFSALVQTATPGLFRFDPLGRRYAAAVFASGEFAGPAGLFGSALATRAVRKGEVVQLFATGLGNAGTQDGQIPEALGDLTSRVSVTIGGQPARVVFAGRTSPGLYQINVEAPRTAATGENQVRVTIGGASSPEGVFLVVE